MALLQVRHLTAEELDVGAAHPGPFDVDDHLPTIGAWRVDLIDRTPTRTGHDKRAHQRFRLSSQDRTVAALKPPRATTSLILWSAFTPEA